jgi:asparagine synthase (glutamine-hydrolysing)
MTALAGYWHFGGKDGTDDCRRMLKAQAIYGQHSADWSDGTIALGRHLFRILPEDALDRGPVIGADGQSALVADIRLDNREELGAALGMEGLNSSSDAALLMAALERWGEDALDRLIGDFAFAHWDGRARKLLLARDFIDARPLHYHRSDRFIAFATMPKGLHALPDVPYDVNLERMRDGLALMPESGPETHFKDIMRVRPGHIVTIRRDGVSSRKYWHPSLEPLLLGSDGEYHEALRHHLDTAVAAQLRGAGDTVGAHLSAGLDSSAVAATAALQMRRRGGKVVAFTHVPRPDYDGPLLPNAIGDEGPLAAATAAMHPNMEHVPIVTSGRSPLDNLDRAFQLYDRPPGNLCNTVWINAINDAARDRGLKVMLVGQMGNMTFSHNGIELLSELLAKGQFGELARTAVALKRNGTRAGTIAARVFGPLLSEPLWLAIRRLRGHGGTLFSPAMRLDEQAQREVEANARERGLDLSYRPRTDGARARLWVLGRVDPGYFHKGALAGWGIDTRDPTSDRGLTEFCLRVPLDQYLKDGVQRALARNGLRDRLPAAVLDEKLKGYQSVDWHEGLTAARPQLEAELERIAASEADKLIDTDWASERVRNWPQKWSQRMGGDYRLSLLRAVGVGHFIRKVKGSN